MPKKLNYKDVAKFFSDNGFVVIDNFLKKEQILNIKKKIDKDKIYFDPKHTYYEKIKNSYDKTEKGNTYKAIQFIFDYVASIKLPEKKK